ncbi:MAG: hypothetical protein E6F98_10800 [Actinobacteria bacterium]|nr:MAG: hypothetical protein E6F98_10800 [Actinomycetota bacterium]
MIDRPRYRNPRESLDTLDLFWVLLAFSVLISLFGMAKRVLAVFEGTREIGMRRAIGTTLAKPAE